MFFFLEGVRLFNKVFDNIDRPFIDTASFLTLNLFLFVYQPGRTLNALLANRRPFRSREGEAGTAVDYNRTQE